MPQLLRKPFGTHGKVHEITPASAGWRYVGFSLYRLRAGEIAAEVAGANEVILVLVEGKAAITGAGQAWGVLGARMDVFEKKPPHCLYLPDGSDWAATAETDCVLAVCSAPGRGDHPARRIGPDGITLTEHGKGNLLPLAEPEGRVWHPAGLHGRRRARRDHGGARRFGGGAERPPPLRRALRVRDVLSQRHGRSAAQLALRPATEVEWMMEGDA